MKHGVRFADAIPAARAQSARLSVRLILLVVPLAVALAASMPAYANLNITATFDSSITGDSNAATIENTINSAIQLYENTFADPITVKIKFQEMSTGLGASSTWLTDQTYSTYLAQLVTDAKGSDDTTALAHLPAGPNNPVGTGQNIYLSTADARAVGLSTAPTSDGFDGTISLNTSITNNTRPPGNPSKYDLFAVTAHEIDEVLGLGSGLGSQFTIRPEDLFRYTSAGGRTYTTSGDDAYFSIDGGTTLLARFNQYSGGDYGDWWSTGAHTPQVQDAFGTPGATPNLGVEVRALDVVGYDLASVPEPSTLLLLTSGLAGLGGIAWRRRKS